MLYFLVELSTDEESQDSPATCSSSDQTKKKYTMRTRRSQDQKKKREERLITAELKQKYGTYIDLIPDLKDLPYFELLFVDREKSVRPMRLQEKVHVAPKRFTVPFKTPVSNEDR